MKALIYGASGDLAQAIGTAFGASGWTVDQVERKASNHPDERSADQQRFQVEERYSEFQPTTLHDCYVFPQSLFLKKKLVDTSLDEIESVLSVGLVEIAKCIRNALQIPAADDQRIDYCVIGSTSTYAGFKETSIYCATKHGLLGLIRSLNDEYASTGRRFWLFSMGTMDTKMGRELVEQDPTTFLPPHDVATRIVTTVTSRSNLFEPEVIIRRRVVG